MAQTIVTGIPHSGTSMLTEWLASKGGVLPKTPLKVRDDDPHRDYDTYESELLRDGFDPEKFRQEFPNGDYLWKTVHLPHQLFDIMEHLTPEVYIIIRDPVFHGNSIARRYGRGKRQIADELMQTYPYLVRIACWLPVKVVRAEELADFLETDRLTRDDTANTLLARVRQDRNYHTLIELSQRDRDIYGV